ncbi:MAG: DEAD/DEAH box helicase [Legionellaceae bacterium]|nr:DEAD/DEAH box helicase [Legionellaceae bacterium]
MSQQKRLDIFKSLSLCDRQLVALKSICPHYAVNGHEERFFMDKVIALGLKTDQGLVLTEKSYTEIVARLIRHKIAMNESKLTISEDLRHLFLSAMSDADMAWVFSAVHTLYPNKFPCSDQLYKNDLISRGYINRAHQAQLMAAIYANRSDYFLVEQDNILYYQTVWMYVEKIFSFTDSLDPAWLHSREVIIRNCICLALLKPVYCEVRQDLNFKTVLSVFLEQDWKSIQHNTLHYYSGIVSIVLGRADQVLLHASQVSSTKSGIYFSLHALLAFLNQEFSEASTLFQKALTAFRKEIRGYSFDSFLGLVYSICLLYIDKDITQLSNYLLQFDKYASAHYTVAPVSDMYVFIATLCLIEQAKLPEAKKTLSKMAQNIEDSSSMHPLSLALGHLLSFMLDQKYVQKSGELIHRHAILFAQQDQLLAAHILYELLEKSNTHQLLAHSFLDQSAISIRFLTLMNVRDAWEYRFQALEGLLVHGSGTTKLAEKRLLWLIDPDKKTVEVVEQSLNKSGAWSAGRNISLKNLKYYYQDEKYNYLSEKDKGVLDCLVSDDNYWYRDTYIFHPIRSWLALVGHPNIAHSKNRGVPIDLRRVEPELHIDEHPKGYQLSLSHWQPEEGVLLAKESMHQYQLVYFSDSFMQIGKILTEKGLLVPAQAKDKILQVIQRAKSDITIHAGIQALGLPEIQGNPQLCVQLLPTKASGVNVSLWVRPLEEQGMYCKPAEGKARLTMPMLENGVETRVSVVRDLKREKKNQQDLLKCCPLLVQHQNEPGIYDIEEPESVLEVLSELQQYAESHPIQVEWPQGQTFKIKQRIFAGSLSFNISSGSNWFEYDGQVNLQNGDVLSMQALLEGLRQASYGRFVRLGNGEFIELSDQLKKQLNILSTISDDNKINPLGAQILSDIVAEAENSTFDAGWKAHVKKMQTMKNHHPIVPPTLQATLRDYQIEGFQYLSRLTHWGVGACLADDMGLGKTIQTIALLLERGPQGAALVIAPTSVVFNWKEELNKFAPTLRVSDMRSDNREALIESATAFDVVLCSYGLLQHNETLLSTRVWETVILDEAQAIKNANTQRWKAVMKLQAKNRVALSGTPIENHLGELWSIFSFINPGLLGSIKKFQEKYSNPIESQQAPGTIHALKTLVSPYILRRMKSEVLTELPPKIEQTIHVEPSEEEVVFYEALRRNAEERMNDLFAENNRIGVLAEITKLRQACCDSSLVDSALSIKNSKLQVFIETVKNIIDNGHKALVFSQYVSFLDIVRKRVEAENIHYQYLDGSTSPANRKKSVAAFQAGEGDLFLLSLKAGGSGLNLTAADYVIHLDPWWNPAVEDQASDRAHRIGQERPVTVYRLVMQNTIEEKIISLHEKKRNLAQDLLSGQGVSGKLSNDDLMDLIMQSASGAREKKTSKQRATALELET